MYPLKHLHEEGHRVTGYWYNPNIHPYQEYRQRLDTFREYTESEGIETIIEDDYGLERFLGAVMPLDRAEHCRICYRMRLDRVARVASERGILNFTTSLLISPYQKHLWIKEEGERAAVVHGVNFLYFDFRPYWREGVTLSKERSMYRQPYCGCIFSEHERYRTKGGNRRA
jgi:predicted adenine nucleotide alpha hydrolase (AANH) superfamily ATPase